jgi:dihydrolipoamide dehydrogenase
MLECDVVVIGGGPGGYVCAIRAAQLGQKTVLVEVDKVGGECLNYGCIPSKSLITVSKLYEKMKDAEKFGLSATGVSLDYGRMQGWKSEVIHKLVAGVESLLKGNGVTLVAGEAEVVDKNRVKVLGPQGDSQEIIAKNLVIATGTRPIQLPGIEYDGSLVIGSKEALELTVRPEHMLVIGGGAIGLEFACMYQKLGSMITIVEVMDQLLPGSDLDAIRVVQRKLEGRGAKVYLKSRVVSVTKQGGRATVEIETPGGTVRVEVDKVLQSVGKRPRTDKLNLAALGVRTDQRGFILTDERMMTSVEGVYAIGDVRGPPLLAHKASKEGLVAAECAAGLASAADWAVIPEAIFTDPEMASAGLTAQKATQAGHPVKAARFSFAALGRALSTGEGEGFVKVVFREDNGLVLGVQIVGPDASNLISEIALAIEMGATVEDIAQTIHPHPTLPEAIMEAAESALGRPIHQMKL